MKMILPLLLAGFSAAAQNTIQPGDPTIRYDWIKPAHDFYRNTVTDSAGNIRYDFVMEDFTIIDSVRKQIIFARYRQVPPGSFSTDTSFTDPAERDRLYGYMATLTNDRIIADANAYTDFLLNRPEVTGAAIGTTGYCFGGRMSMVTAGGLNGKIAAAASFHGGGIAVAGDPSSPHLAANKITATVYVAGAQEDKHFTPEQAELLENALTEAGVDHTVEFYPARHGFAVTDNAVYDADAEARHWEALRTLYAAHLG